MAYHPWCGGEQFGDRRPHTFLMSNYADKIRQIFIDCSKYFVYTEYRTFVWYRLSWKG